jgi:hypothetical protein
LHNDWLDTETTVGVGLTLIAKDVGEPTQPAADGVTVIFEVTSDVPVLIAANAAIVPAPLDARPIDVLSLVQLYVVPLPAPLKFTVVVDDPLHTDWLDTVATTGVGLTLIVNDVEEPEQPVAVGVTVILAVAIDVPELTVVNDEISPVPLEGRPIDVLSLVQL